MSAPVTQWFAAHEKPSRVGEYEGFFPGTCRGIERIVFNGEIWLDLYGNQVLLFVAFNDVWRGLADKPVTTAKEEL